MNDHSREKFPSKTPITVEDVKRVLEIGRLLLQVLTDEELEQLQMLLTEKPIPVENR